MPHVPPHRPRSRSASLRARAATCALIFGAALPATGWAAPAGPEAAAAAPAPGALPHGADLGGRAPRGAQWDAWGEARGRSEHLSAFALDDRGTPQPTGQWFETRLIAGGRFLPADGLRLELELEALNGRIAGDGTDLGAAATADPFAYPRAAGFWDSPERWAQVLPRKAMIGVDRPTWRASLGAQTFTWGTGMLANAGDGDPAFGDARTGSVVARAGLVATPWRQREGRAAQGLGFVLATDVVLRDDNASWAAGDRVFQGVGGLRWRLRRAELGALAVVRRQADREDPLRPVDPAAADPEGAGTTARATPLDLYAKVQVLGAPDGLQRLVLEGELVHVRGWTDRPYLEETVPDGAQLRSLGALLRATYEDDPLRLTARVEGGYASGDNDPRDAVVRGFTMHTDHNVGIILFEQALPLMGARAADRVADPALMAVPPSGLRYTIPQGGVTNAIYAFPTLRWRPWVPLELRAGAVLAKGAGDVIDVYHSGISGGWPATPGGALIGDSAPARGLGVELDAAIRADLALPGATRLQLGVEGATWRPGPAFAGVIDDPVHALRLRAALGW